MSTLTKVLIVLLTVSSIFLCGVVVTYVANAANYRERYKKLLVERDAALENEKSAKNQANETIEEANRQKEKLNAEIAALEGQIRRLEGELKTVEAAKEDALRRVNNWAAIVMDFSKTIDKNEQLVKDTLDELRSVKAELIKEQSQHEETEAALFKNMAIVAQLEDRNKQLVEEKTALQNRLDRYYLKFGKAVTPAPPVTPIKEKARVAVIAKDIELKGLITAVDLKGRLAEISIGEADGVREGMRFHVTRGDKFICDVVILDVDPETAGGILELMEVTREQPEAGDKVSTSL